MGRADVVLHSLLQPALGVVLHQHADLLVLRHDHGWVVPAVSVRAAKLWHGATLVRFKSRLERCARARGHHASQRAHGSAHRCDLQLCQSLLFNLVCCRSPKRVRRGSQLSCVVFRVMQILSTRVKLVDLLGLRFDMRWQSDFRGGHGCLVLSHLLLFLQQRRRYYLLDLIETIVI